MAEAPSRADWLLTRHYLRERRWDLSREAVELYPQLLRVGESTLLGRPEWLPPSPLALGEVPLARSHLPAAPAADLPWPSAALPADFRSYVDAVATLDPPRLLEDRLTYRLAGADLNSLRPGMSFGAGTYFDVLNVGEAVAHEFAHRRRVGGDSGLDGLPLRRRIGDPTDPARRPMLVAITTLTIRYDHGSRATRFLTHWRDPAKVATNGGSYQLAPVGMFQPASDASTDEATDFDLWRCMAREYSEELLGAAEHHDVDYERWPFFRALQLAREADECRPYLLGVGVDPLTLATDVLTVVVFGAPTFDRLFAGLVESNLEGRMVVQGDDGLLGTSFAHEPVRRLVHEERMQPAGAAALDLAWRYRDLLLTR